jgi:hypothetical protein
MAKVTTNAFEWGSNTLAKSSFENPITWFSCLLIFGGL